MDIRCIVRIRRMLRSWRLKTASSRRLASDVPPGHVAVCVGENRRRYIVRATHLNHPIFRRLLDKIAEEYGFPNYSGPLWIPCDESRFEQILRCVDLDLRKNCRRIKNENDEADRLGQSPLLLLCGFTT